MITMYDVWHIKRNAFDDVLPTEFLYQATVAPSKPKVDRDSRVSRRMGHFIIASDAARKGFPDNYQMENFDD